LAVKHRFQGVKPEPVFLKNMPPDFIQHLTFKVDKGSAFFTFQVEMFPAFRAVTGILITGAFSVIEYIFAEFPLLREFFQMPVDRGLPYAFPLIGEKPGRLIHRNVPAPQGLKIIQDPFSLAGTVIRRTAVFHNRQGIRPFRYCQYENENYFHIRGKKNWRTEKTGALSKPAGFETRLNL
jgi:hypothetical protein